MGSNSSFYNQSGTIYTDTNPPGPVDAPVPTTVSDAPSSFYKAGGRLYPVTSTSDVNTIIAIAVPGPSLLPNEWLFGYDFDFSATFDADLAGSVAVARTAATGSGVLNLLKNGTQFGTLTFTGTTGVFSAPLTTFNIGDVLEVVAAAAVDLTLAHLTISLFALRN